MSAASKVTFNTGILYARMLITMGISLYSTRILLNALGDLDYGIFNLVAGIIVMLSFLNAAMTTSTQRYLSFYQGTNDLEKQKTIFNSSLLLHVVVGLCIVLTLRMIGPFIFDGILNIPQARIDVAKTIYNFMSITVFFTIVGVPFNGSLAAHENMGWVAMVNIVESILKFLSAYSLFYVTTDKLQTYGLFTALISVSSFVLYTTYCLKNYKECSLNIFSSIDKTLLSEIGSFAAWNLFGALCAVGRNQGLAVILNLFFGAVINTTYGIASQVNSQLNFFSATMIRALNPQIMKSEGAGDRNRMIRLSMMASKFSFLLLTIFAIPIIFELPAILTLWLGKIPEGSVTFCSLILISSMISQLSVGLQSAVQATGKIKIYQTIVGSTLLLTIPLAYLFLKTGQPPYFVLLAVIIIEILAAAIRLLLLKKMMDVPIMDYLGSVVGRIIFPVIASTISAYICVFYFEHPLRFLLTGISSTTALLVTGYFLGLTSDERKILNNIWLKLQGKLTYDKATLKKDTSRQSI